MDSNPTKNHGARATIFNTCASGLPPSGENAGAMDFNPPPWQKRLAAKHTATPTANVAASTACTPPAVRLRQQMTAADMIAAIESMMSPSDTSKPLML